MDESVTSTDDGRRQSILKPRIRVPLQEVPNFFPDDDTTTTMTKNRRVSFGRKVIKKFIVGSAASTRAPLECEQTSESLSESSDCSGPLDLAVNKSNRDKSPPPSQVPQTGNSRVNEDRARLFTENCISIAKSVFQDCETELTAIIIGAKPTHPDTTSSSMNFTNLDQSLTQPASQEPAVPDKSRYDFLDRSLSHTAQQLGPMKVTRQSMKTSAFYTWDNECEENIPPAHFSHPPTPTRIISLENTMEFTCAQSRKELSFAMPPNSLEEFQSSMEETCAKSQKLSKEMEESDIEEDPLAGVANEWSSDVSDTSPSGLREKLASLSIMNQSYRKEILNLTRGHESQHIQQIDTVEMPSLEIDDSVVHPFDNVPLENSILSPYDSDDGSSCQSKTQSNATNDDEMEFTECNKKDAKPSTGTCTLFQNSESFEETDVEQMHKDLPRPNSENSPPFQATVFSQEMELTRSGLQQQRKSTVLPASQESDCSQQFQATSFSQEMELTKQSKQSQLLLVNHETPDETSQQNGKLRSIQESLYSQNMEFMHGKTQQEPTEGITSEISQENSQPPQSSQETVFSQSMEFTHGPLLVPKTPEKLVEGIRSEISQENSQPPQLSQETVFSQSMEFTHGPLLVPKTPEKLVEGMRSEISQENSQTPRLCQETVFSQSMDFTHGPLLTSKIPEPIDGIALEISQKDAKPIRSSKESDYSLSLECTRGPEGQVEGAVPVKLKENSPHIPSSQECECSQIVEFTQSLDHLKPPDISEMINNQDSSLSVEMEFTIGHSQLQGENRQESSYSPDTTTLDVDKETEANSCHVMELTQTLPKSNQEQNYFCHNEAVVLSLEVHDPVRNAQNVDEEKFCPESSGTLKDSSFKLNYFGGQLEASCSEPEKLEPNVAEPDTSSIENDCENRECSEVREIEANVSAHMKNEELLLESRLNITDKNCETTSCTQSGDGLIEHPKTALPILKKTQLNGTADLSTDFPSKRAHSESPCPGERHKRAKPNLQGQKGFEMADGESESKKRSPSDSPLPTERQQKRNCLISPLLNVNGEMGNSSTLRTDFSSNLETSVTLQDVTLSLSEGSFCARDAVTDYSSCQPNFGNILLEAHPEESLPLVAQDKSFTVTLPKILLSQNIPPEAASANGLPAFDNEEENSNSCETSFDETNLWRRVYKALAVQEKEATWRLLTFENSTSGKGKIKVEISIDAQCCVLLEISVREKSAVIEKMVCSLKAQESYQSPHRKKLNNLAFEILDKYIRNERERLKTLDGLSLSLDFINAQALKLRTMIGDALEVLAGCATAELEDHILSLKFTCVAVGSVYFVELNLRDMMVFGLPKMTFREKVCYQVMKMEHLHKFLASVQQPILQNFTRAAYEWFDQYEKKFGFVTRRPPLLF